MTALLLPVARTFHRINAAHELRAPKGDAFNDNQNAGTSPQRADHQASTPLADGSPTSPAVFLTQFGHGKPVGERGVRSSPITPAPRSPAFFNDNHDGGVPA